MASNVMGCDYCGAEFTDLPQLLDHEEAHRVAGNEPLPELTCIPSPVQNDEVAQCSTSSLKEQVGFQCDQCPKVFKVKDCLTRHIKCKHSGARYPCATCGKTFEYVGARTRHEKHCQGKENICETCGKRCSTAGGLRRHQDLHNKALQQKQTPQQPIKRKSSQSRQVCKAKKGKTVSSKPSSYRCRRCNDIFPNRHELYLHGMQHHYQVGGGLQPRPWNEAPWEQQDGTVDNELREVYEANAPLILGPDQPGPIQSIYNFPVSNDVSVPQLNRFAAEIFDREQHAFKLNLSFGVILQHRETGQYRYFTPYRNTVVFEAPIYISKRTDLRRLHLRLRRLDILDQLLRNRPDTKWIPVLITNVEYYVTGTNYPVGQGELPDFLLETHSLYPLVKNRHNGKLYEDNLCLFRCLTLHKGHEIRCIDGPARDLYQQWTQHKKCPEPFPGVSVAEFPEFEKFFEVDLEVYSLSEDGEARSIYKSRGRFNNNMYVNLYENHTSYIKDFSAYAQKYRCSTCDRHFHRIDLLHKHQKSCTGKTKFVYPGGFHKSPQTIFQKLEAYGIFIPEDERIYPYFICYDFEAILQTIDDSPTEFLTWTQKHVPISVSICSNVTGYTDPYCIVDTNPNQIIKNMVSYMKCIAIKVEELAKDKWKRVIDEIEDQLKHDMGVGTVNMMKLPTHPLDDDSDDEEGEGERVEENEEEENETEDKHLIQLYGEFKGYMSQVPVLAFNSAKYDLNLVKQYLTRHLQMHEEERAYVIKKNNAYTCISTSQLKFLDMSQFLAPGSSYAGFLKAYGVSEQKGFFPYQWFDDPDKLNYNTLPTHEEFYNTLKNSNLSDQEYQYCQKVWKENNMSTFKDFLVWYNNLDVGPFVEAITKFQQFYFEKDIDVFKTAVSVPGIARQLLFQSAKEHNASFALFDNADLFDTVKRGNVGGPSIVFCRRHKAQETKIRGGKLCQKIVGFDANALYLWAIDQPMPVGPYIRRLANNDFRPEIRDRYMAAFNWLDHVMKRKNVQILHQRNNGAEIRIGKYPVDGFQAPVTKGDKPIVYQYHGCYWHGHDCHLTKNVKDERWHKTREQKFKRTEKITAYLRKKGCEVIEMWECNFKIYCRLHPDIYEMIDGSRPTFFQQFKRKQVTEGDIVEGIREGKLFGMVEVDISLPEAWPSHFQHTLTPCEYFQEMSPIFCTTEIPFQSFGKHMQEHVKLHNLSQAPRRLLVGGMKAKEILLATPLLKWYIDHGMKIERVHQVIEYQQQRCFRQFVKEVSDARRKGDLDKNTAIIADTMKVIGNSAYGSMIMDKSKHRDVQYVQGENETCLKVNEPRFRKLECLDMEQHFYELEMAKNKIKYDLPIQLGFFILQYAKQHMLSFYYDFMDKFVDRSDFEYCEMDTDSAYMAISANSIDDIIKPEMKSEYDKRLRKYCHSIEIQADGLTHWFPRACCDKHAKYDKRTPGLFKLEYEGEEIISLSSKSYIISRVKTIKPTNTKIIAEKLLQKAKGSKKQVILRSRQTNEVKFSSKGVNKRRLNAPMSKFRNVLQSGKSINVTNMGFRARNNTIYTYTQEKRGFSYFYCKRKVADDGIHTSPLDLVLCPKPPEDQKQDEINDEELFQMLDNCFED